MTDNSKSPAILNEVQTLLISHANSNGINLADHFKTVQEFKDFVIGFAFKGLLDAGMDVPEAFDATIGEGQYEALFNSLAA